MASIRFKEKLFDIGSWTILQLPKAASVKLPSRGATIVEGTINGFPFQAVLEPDGKGSHWFQLDKKLLKAAKVKSGDAVTLDIKPGEEWPEPTVPADLKKALSSTPSAHALWKQITPMARWDWIRWIRSTKQAETRAKRIRVAMSKLNAGTRRPCCFNRSMCTEPEVSQSGVLMEAK